jgi:hypothetical protein
MCVVIPGRHMHATHACRSRIGPKRVYMTQGDCVACLGDRGSCPGVGCMCFACWGCGLRGLGLQRLVETTSIHVTTNATSAACHVSCACGPLRVRVYACCMLPEVPQPHWWCHVVECCKQRHDKRWRNLLHVHGGHCCHAHGRCSQGGADVPVFGCDLRPSQHLEVLSVLLLTARLPSPKCNRGLRAMARAAN